MAAFGVLALLYVVAVFADFVAPYDYAENEVRDLSYTPPTIHFRDAGGRWHLRPFVYRRWYRFDEMQNRVWIDDPSNRYPVVLFARGSKHKVLWLFETDRHLFGLGHAIPVPGAQEPAPDPVWGNPGEEECPARIYIMGADGRGRDLFSRVCFGARISLSIGLIGSAITFVIGMIVGGISGYFGGWVDMVIQRICEMIMMIPSFYLMLALRSALPLDLPSTWVYLMIVCIMSFIGWAGFARVIRGLVFSIRARDFVTAARAAGAGRLRTIVVHVLPNTLSYAIISVTLSIPGYILGESALSLIGLGIQDPQASWGNLLSDAMSIAEIRFHPWMLIPGLMIFIAVVGFNMFGDGLRDAFDPQGLTRQARR